MFNNCKSLTSIYFPNIKTEKAKYLDFIFNGCEKLTSLNLSNFITSKVINFAFMFNGCKSLKLLDFSNLEIKNVQNSDNVKNIFLGCKNLEFLNINNINSDIELKNEFFNGFPTNKLIICINDEKIQLIKDLLDNNKCILINCDSNLIKYEDKLNTENECLTKKCSLVNYNYEFQKSCFEECPDNSIKREEIIELEGIELKGKYFCKSICNETYPFELISQQKCVKNCDIKVL